MIHLSKKKAKLYENIYSTFPILKNYPGEKTWVIKCEIVWDLILLR